MIIKELKKKNYFRYLQLYFHDLSEDDESIIIFLFEAELYKIFNSSQEVILRKIRYQWIIDELSNEYSKFALIKNIFLLTKKYLIKDEIIKILVEFQNIEGKISSKKDIENFFKRTNLLFSKILKKIYTKKDNLMKTHYFFQLIYFFYLKKTDNFFPLKEFYEEYLLIRNFNIETFEVVFIDLFFKKKKSENIVKINKLEFILKLIMSRILS